MLSKPSPKMLLSFLLLVSVLAFASCNPASPKSFPPLETKGASEPIFTPEPPTPTFTSTPTPYPFVTDGTPLPPLEPITEDNVNRLVKVAEWGRGHLTDAEWSPDGKMIAVGTLAGIYLYEASSLKQIRFIRPTDLGIEVHSGFNLISFSPDGDFIATYVRELIPPKDVNKIILINLQTGALEKVVGEISDPSVNIGTWNDLAFSPDGRLVATGTNSGIYIYDVTKEELIRKLETDSDVYEVSFSPDGKTLAALTTKLFLWDIGSWSSQHESLSEELWNKSVTPVNMDFSPDSNMIVMDDGNEGPTIVNLTTNEITTLPSEQPYGFTDVDFSSDGTRIVGLQIFGTGKSYVGEHNIYIWDVNGNNLQRYQERLNDGDLNYSFIEFSPDNMKIATVFSDQVFRILDVDNLQVQSAIQLNDGINDTDFTPDSTAIGIAGGSSIYSIWLRKTLTGEISRFYTGNPSRKIVFSPDGNLIANDSGEEFEDNVTGHVWNANDGRLKYKIRLPSNAVSGSAGLTAGPIFSYDSRLIAGSYTTTSFATQPPTHEANIYIWNMADGKIQQVIKGSNYQIEYLSFSPDGQWLAAYTCDEPKNYEMGCFIKIWKMPNGSLEASIPAPSYSSIIFSPDSRYMAMDVSSMYLQLWDTTKWKEIWKTTSEGSPAGQKGDSIQISPDGKLIAMLTVETGSDFYRPAIRIFNLSNGVLLKSLYDPNQLLISDLEISPDGTMLAVSLHSGIIQIWGVPK